MSERDGTPTLRLNVSRAAALSPDALRSLESRALLAFLRGQRWFGAGAREAIDARVGHVLSLPWGDGIALATVDVALSTATSNAGANVHVYLVALAVSADHGGRCDLVDAVDSPDFRAGFAAAVDAGGTIEGSTARVRFIHEAGAADAGSTLLASHPAFHQTAEQSNSSIIFGDAALAKVFRRIEAGVHPDVEISRFLTSRTAFRNTPSLLGTAVFESVDEAPITIALIQRFVPDARGAWDYALEQVRRYLTAPGEEQPPNAFMDDAANLGRMTREMHTALASVPDDPDFAPRAASQFDIAEWATLAERSVKEGFALLDARVGDGVGGKQPVPAETAGAARVLLRRRAEFPALIREYAAGVGTDAGAVMRHHGDLHLGQVLRSPDDEFFVIDFEGEPSRPLEERRAPSSPLRDVAGMLRSFSYASAVGLGEAIAAGGTPRAVLEIRSGTWLRDVRVAFMHGYLEAHDSQTPILPRLRESVSKLVALFEIEKVFYELRYEMNNRPDWVWIPLRGIARLTEATTRERGA